MYNKLFNSYLKEYVIKKSYILVLKNTQDINEK